MDAIELLRERQSVRKYRNESVSRELMTEIVKLSQFAPSWSNYQIARYNIIDNKSLIEEIADNCLQGSYITSRRLSVPMEWWC